MVNTEGITRRLSDDKHKLTLDYNTSITIKVGHVEHVRVVHVVYVILDHKYYFWCYKCLKCEAAL